MIRQPATYRPFTALVICKRCELTFECVQKTRPAVYCEPCKIIIQDAQRTASRERMRALRARPAPETPPRKLIRYAGFDPTEQSFYSPERTDYDQPESNGTAAV